MRRFIILLIACMVTNVAMSQVLMATFTELTTDKSAKSGITVIKDENGKKTLIVRVSAQGRELEFKNEGFDIINTVSVNNERWLYLPEGSHTLSIKDKKTGAEYNYKLPIEVKKARVYKLHIVIDERKEKGVVYVTEPEFLKAKENSKFAFRNWVAERVEFPEEFLKFGVKGLVVAQFIIGEDGSIQQLKITKSPHESLTKEVARVIYSSPKWKPATFNGKPTPVDGFIRLHFNP